MPNQLTVLLTPLLVLGLACSPAPQRQKGQVESAPQRQGQATPAKGASPVNQPGRKKSAAPSPQGSKGEASPLLPEDEVTPVPQGPGRSGVHDDRNDLDSGGDPPAWIDLIRVTATSKSGRIVFKLEVDGSIPATTGDGQTFASLGVRISLPGDREAQAYLDGNSSGWRGYFTSEGRSRPLDRSSISGRRATIELPLSAIDSPKRFSWSSYTSWTRSTLLEVHYGFDSAPQGGVIHHRT